MKDNSFDKILVTGIITLFIGVGVVQGINFHIDYNERHLDLESWWNEEWMYRKQITIHHDMIEEDLQNFPVLMIHTSSDFADNAQSDGDDFKFLSEDNSFQYNHEIEIFKSTSGRLIVWVNITNLNSTEDKILWIYYGNSECGNQENIEGTWDNYYVGVWHMNEVSGNIQDSTGTKDGNVVGSPAYHQSVEKIYKSIYFDGSNTEYFDITNNIYKFYDEDVTLEAWVYYSENRNYYETPVDFGDTDRYPTMYLQKIRSGFETFPGHLSAKENFSPEDSGYNEAYSNTGGSSHIGDWIYQVGRFERGVETSLYVNGVKQDYTDSCENNNLNGGSNFNARIGSGVKTTNYYPKSIRGYIDEVRISKDIARSEAWISTSYNNLNDSESYITFGEEEVVSNRPPYEPTNPEPEDGESDVPVDTYLSWTGGDPDGDPVTYDIFFGKTTPLTKVESNQTLTIYNPGNLDFDSNYYWQIIAWDNQSAYSESDVWEFTTVLNHPPSIPGINGPNSGKKGKKYSYTFVSTDPDEHDVFYQIDWGDGNVEEWFGPHESNDIITKDHTWSKEGNYTIMARAKDEFGAIGEWGTLAINMPKNKPYVFNFPLLNWLFEKFPYAFTIIKNIIGLT